MSTELQLSAAQNKLLYEALSTSFENFADLRTVVFLELGDPLNDISENLPLTRGAVSLIQWAKSRGKLRLLSDAVVAARSGSPAVETYKATLKSTVLPALPANDFQEVAPRDAWPAKASGLESLVQEGNCLVLATDWAAAMRKAQGLVCLIENEAGNPVGTGFLVGSNSILTNCHVYRQLENKKTNVRFDYFCDNAGKKFQIVDRLAVSTEDRLDFALLKLGCDVEPERTRIAPKDHRFERDQIQLILQHAKGKPLQLGIGHVTAILPERVVYSTNTEPGSSGSPVFTMNWELVAIHHYGDPRNNIGIPIAPIWKMLAKEGHV